MTFRSFPLLALVAALAVLSSAAAPASASEGARMEAFWVRAGATTGGRVERDLPGLLNLPAGWTACDAVVVMLSDGSWPGPGRERLLEALLAEGAAVLELDVDAARGSGRDDAQVGPHPFAAELALAVRAAVEALQRDAAAGLVVALGHGAGGGGAALLAASAARAEPGDGLAAGASLGPGRPEFALGGVPLEGEMGVHRGWPARARRLCRVLAEAAAPLDAGADCRRALVAPVEAPPARVAER